MEEKKIPNADFFAAVSAIAKFIERTDNQPPKQSADTDTVIRPTGKDVETYGNRP